MPYWLMCFFLTGIGLGMVIITFLCSVYYNVIMAWTFYYLFASFQKHLPWESCDKSWNSKLCQYVFSLSALRCACKLERVQRGATSILTGFHAGLLQFEDVWVLWREGNWITCRKTIEARRDPTADSTHITSLSRTVVTRKCEITGKILRKVPWHVVVYLVCLAFDRSSQCFTAIKKPWIPAIVVSLSIVQKCADLWSNDAKLPLPIIIHFDLVVHASSRPPFSIQLYDVINYHYEHALDMRWL